MGIHPFHRNTKGEGETRARERSGGNIERKDRKNRQSDKKNLACGEIEVAVNSKKGGGSRREVTVIAGDWREGSFGGRQGVPTYPRLKNNRKKRNLLD